MKKLNDKIIKLQKKFDSIDDVYTQIDIRTALHHLTELRDILLEAQVVMELVKYTDRIKL